MSFFTGNDDIEAGEGVMFATYMPGRVMTRTAQEDFNDRMATFKAVADDYEFNVEMYQKGEGENPPTLLGNANYLPTKTEAIENEGQENETVTVTYASDGTLVSKTGVAPLYWPGNAKEYGFKATAGTTTLEVDQTTAEKLLQQDRLLGYGFEPLWNSEGNAPTDNEDDLNFRTSKQWYKADQQRVGLTDASDEYKKIPLYLKHQRSLITIILKAGEGVNRSALKELDNIQTMIFSYGETAEDNKTIYPLAANTTVNYVASDYGGAEDDGETSEYTAVVEPHNYLEAATSHAIAEIRLSGQRFTFYASNDFQYSDYLENVTDAVNHMNGYNLIPGKHLTIVATLGRGSRKILITAYVEDWTEAVTTSIVDDYGQAGDPIQINSRQQLYEFLTDNTKNKAGNVAIIVPNSINLEKNGDADLAWNYTN